eukprot:103058_1
MASFVFYITWIASARTMTSNLQSNHLDHDLRSNSDACFDLKWTNIENEWCCDASILHYVPITEMHQNKPFKRSTWDILSPSRSEPCQCSDTYGSDLPITRSALSQSIADCLCYGFITTSNRRKAAICIITWIAF